MGPYEPDPVGEGTTLEFDIYYVNSTSFPFSVDYETVDISADAGSDYTAVSGTVNSDGTVGAFTQHIEMPITWDGDWEEEEQFSFRLFNPQGQYLQMPTPPEDVVVFTIHDQTATVSISTVSSGSEDPVTGGSGTTPMQFLVTRSGGDIGRPLTVYYSLAGTGLDPVNTSDYTTPSGEVTIAASSYAAAIEVAVSDDSSVEAAYEQATTTVAAGDGYVFTGFDAVNNPNPDAPTAVATIQDNDFQIVVAKAWFDDQGLKGDDGNAYDVSWIDWNADGDAADANEQSKSISYFRSDATTNRFVTAMIYFEVEGNATSSVYTISGTGTGPGGGTFEDQISLQTNGTTKWFYAAPVSDTRLPTTIDAGQLNIDWTITPNNRPTEHVSYSATNNTIYVTGASAANQFETVVKIGCEGAAGINPDLNEDANGNGTLDTGEDSGAGNGILDPGEDANGNGVLDVGEDVGNGLLDAAAGVVNGIWAKFSGLSVERMDGLPMVYTHVNGTGMDAAEMLAHAQGYGQCTAWAELLEQTLTVQGIDASRVTMSSPYGFVVKEMSAQESTGSYTYWGTTTSRPFGFHEVVVISGDNRVYDPSYGYRTAQASTLDAAKVDYEDHSLNGILDINGGLLLNTSNKDLQW